MIFIGLLAIGASIVIYFLLRSKKTGEIPLPDIPSVPITPPIIPNPVIPNGGGTP